MDIDEHEENKLLKLHNFIIFYRRFYFITSIATVTIFLVIKSYFEEDRFYINKFIENWGKKPVEDIKFTTNECPNSYEHVTLGYWPTSPVICDCRNAYFIGEDEHINVNNANTEFNPTGHMKYIKPYPCNMFYKLIGCKDSDEMKKFNINVWKGRNVCIKRHSVSYLDNLLMNFRGQKNGCDRCELKDSINQNLCVNQCPMRNQDIGLGKEDIKVKVGSINKNGQIDISATTSIRKLGAINTNFRENNKIKTNFRKKEENFTTYDDLELIYNKNFNISINNEIIGNFAVSDIIMSEHYPCLILHSAPDKINEVKHLFNFILSNLQVLDAIKKPQVNTSGNNTTSNSFSENNFNLLNFTELDKNECYFHDNSYFDRRYFIIDILNFFQFMFNDLNNDGLKFKNTNITLSITENDINNKDNFTPTTTMFLLSSPFYGWNIRSCPENPEKRMKGVLQLYDSATLNLNIIIFLKIVCFAYLYINGLFEKFYEDKFHFAIYTHKSNRQNNIRIFFDMIYYLLTVFIICQLVHVCFRLKNLTYYQYLFMIRNDCVDEYSVKLLNYLYDICEEKFIYCVFVMAFNILEFIFFTIIFKKSYEIKLTLK
jgi:hypothetical protein